jgi:hypothetical protein
MRNKNIVLKNFYTSVYLLHSSSHPSITGVILFFKVRDRVKKAVFTGKNLDDLNKLFMEKYPDFPRYHLLLTAFDLHSPSHILRICFFSSTFTFSMSFCEITHYRYSLRPFTILNQQSQIPHELDSVSDLYSNCILEIKYEGSTSIFCCIYSSPPSFSLRLRNIFLI